MGACQSKPAIVDNEGIGAQRPDGSSEPAESKSTVKVNQTVGNPAETSDYSSETSTGKTQTQSRASHAPGYASGASTPDDRSLSEASANSGSFHSHSRSKSNPKVLSHSTSAIGLDEMIETRKEGGDLRQNVVHIEVPFGKPIEEVYEGVHTGPVLGSGISGLVRLVTHKATGIKYAVKCLDLGLVDTAEGLHQLREEIFIMCQLDHPNIVRLEEVYESHSEIYLVQELCLGGELFDRLDEQPDYHYTEAQCARLVKNMLCAVRYLHSKGIIHRDLKLENFLFSSTAQDSELKMIDFGLSKHFRYGEVHHEAVGTPYTVAPEVIRGSYDERCDIWAIGVITFLLLSGDPPFGGCGGPEPLMTVRANILKGAFAFEPEDIWATVSPLARDFIQKLLVVDPQRRPTAKEAQKHSWLKEWASRTKREDDNILNPNVVKALVNFKEFSDMRKLLCEVLSFTLLPDQIKDLRREFEKMDTDGSGEISLAALKQVLMTNAGAGSLGALKEEEVEDIFNAMRVRKTETRIHWHEFLAAGLSQCQVDDRNLRLAFDRLDSDHKGYITLDDIMNLFGNDASQSEEAMHQMWGDSMKILKGQQARITYDDFLLLMKGQTTDPTAELEMEQKMLENSMSLLGRSQLDVVPEVMHEVPSPEHDGKGESVNGVAKQNGKNIERKDIPLESAGISLETTPTMLMKPALMPKTPSAPEHDKMDSPFSMDDINDGFCKPGIPGTAASLTPPMTPTRGAQDYITPLGGRRSVDFNLNKLEGMMMPGLPSAPSGGNILNNPPPNLAYVRRRSRSLGEQDEKDEDREKSMLELLEKEKEPHFEKDARRAMMLPEHDHNLTEIDAIVKDETKSALVVNRKLYRAHRQMRLAVLEASKRFEEQQARHAKEVILAQRQAEEGSEEIKLYHAGLVMRHGHKEQVSSEAVKLLLQEHREKQQALVEKATKRGGRGRRNRKKTCSDMSGMLTSLEQDHQATLKTNGSKKAVQGDISESENEDVLQSLQPIAKTHSSERHIDDVDDATQDELPQLRGATVPGEFRKTKDPFGADGRYGLAKRGTTY